MPMLKLREDSRHSPTAKESGKLTHERRALICSVLCRVQVLIFMQAGMAVQPQLKRMLG